MSETHNEKDLQVKKVNDSDVSLHDLSINYLKGLQADEDLSFSDLLEILWRGRFKLILITAAFFLLGIFHYTFSPTEYVSDSKLLKEAENQQGASSGLQFLGQLGGINLGSSMQQNMIPSELYPEIVESVDFQEQLLYQPVMFSTFGEEITLFDYFNEYYQLSFRDRFYRTVINYTVRLPFTLYYIVRGVFAGEQVAVEESEEALDSEVLMLSPQFRYAMSEMKNRITLESEGMTIEVETKLPDPMAAARVNLIVTDRIRQYVTEYRSEKARSNLEFLQGLHQETKERYELAQYNLAQFMDQNQGTLTSIAQIELEQLEDEKSLTFQIYSSISGRLEDARVRLQEDTPIFTTFQRPVLPTEPERSSALILVVFLIFGVFMGALYLFLEKGFYSLKDHLAEIRD